MPNRHGREAAAELVAAAIELVDLRRLASLAGLLDKLGQDVLTLHTPHAAAMPRLMELADVVTASRPPDKRIGRNGDDYLLRWFLERNPAEEHSTYAVYLHRFVGDDPEPPHNHPWSSASIGIAGRQREHVRHADGSRSVNETGPATVSLRTAALTHRLERIGDETPVTLFATGARGNDWGWITADGGFIPSERASEIET